MTEVDETLYRICDNCGHFDNEASVCRRYAPRPIVLHTKEDADNPTVFWPTVTKNDFCGEFVYGASEYPTGEKYKR